MLFTIIEVSYIDPLVWIFKRSICHFVTYECSIENFTIFVNICTLAMFFVVYKISSILCTITPYDRTFSICFAVLDLT